MPTTTNGSKPVFQDSPIENDDCPSKNTSSEMRNPAEPRFCTEPVTIGRLMGAVAVIGSLLVFGTSWYSLFVFEAVAIYVFSEILVAYLPSSFSMAMKRNCIRQDGSWSEKRQAIESRAIQKLRWDIRIVMLLVFIPTTMMVWIVDREVVPIRIGIGAVTAFSLSEQAWNENWSGESREFEKWAQGNSNPVQADQHKRILRDYWIVIMLGGILWLMVGWLIIQKSFIYQLRELATGIKNRGEAYIQHDRAQYLRQAH